MKKILLLGLFLLLLVGCNFPGRAAVTRSPAAPDQTATPPNSITSVPFPTQTPTQTPTVVPSDLPFTIDCSALPAARQTDCDSFIARTRDQVYPVLREVTGVSLSPCYKNMRYVILPADPKPNAGGLSGGDTITYNEKYSIDLPHAYDVHELLHSISTCARALDGHVFHGMIMNYVYDRLGVHDPGYFEDRSSQNLTIILDNLLQSAKTAGGAELNSLCQGILIRKITLAYFDLGKPAVQPLYRSTIYPPKIATPPGPMLIAAWGGAAGQVEALLETLQRDYQYNIDVPECGY